MSVYLIVDLDVKDPEAYAKYRAEAPAFISKHGGEYLVRGGATEVIEGSWQPHRLVILRFPDKAAAKAFLDDPGYAPVAAVRHRAAATDLVLVEGI